MSKKFMLRHVWEVYKDYEIEAETAKEAADKLRAQIKAGGVCVWTDGYVTGDDDYICGTPGEKCF